MCSGVTLTSGRRFSPELAPRYRSDVRAALSLRRLVAASRPRPSLRRAAFSDPIDEASGVPLATATFAGGRGGLGGVVMGDEDKARIPQRHSGHRPVSIDIRRRARAANSEPGKIPAAMMV